MKNNRNITRREMLKLLGMGAGASILAGCAPKTEEIAPEVVDEAPEEVVEEVKEVVLRFQNHWSKETDAHYDGMPHLYDTFHAANPGVTIENVLNPDGDASFQKILADCAAGDCPEIIHGPTGDMFESGFVLDLTDIVESDPAWKAQQIESTFYTSNGRIYGLCAEYSNMPTIWNTRILEAAGVGEIPTTWDAFLDACEKIKSYGKTPTSWGVGGAHAWHNIVASQEGGLEALGADQFDAPQVREAFAQMKVWVDNGWIPDNEIEYTWQQSVANFVAEETAYYLNGAWTLANEIRSDGAAKDLQDVVKFSPFPAFGAKGTTVELKVTTPIGIAADVVDTPGQLEAAVAFLKHWFTPEMAAQWILLTNSPMGVDVDVNAIEGVDPLLLDFLATVNQADAAYALPPTKAMLERGWDDSWSGLQALMIGGSIDDAVTAMVEEMSAYK
jgi:ABC-type glycerol-3-phosphate transport system substrate-binding protein